MHKPMVLSQKQDAGVIFTCRDGVVRVTWGYVTLRFQEQVFIDFALMVKEAFSAMAEHSLEGLLVSEEPQDPPP